MGFEGTVEEFERQKMENLLTIVGKFENGWYYFNNKIQYYIFSY